MPEPVHDRIKAAEIEGILRCQKGGCSAVLQADEEHPEYLRVCPSCQEQYFLMTIGNAHHWETLPTSLAKLNYHLTHDEELQRKLEANRRVLAMSEAKLLTNPYISI